MKRHPTPAAPNTLQPGYYIFWRHRTYHVIALDPANALLLQVEPIPAAPNTTLSLLDLLATPQKGTDPPLFAPTLELLHEQVEDRYAIRSSATTDDLPDNYLIKARIITTVVETVGRLLAEEERRAALRGESLGRTQALHRALGTVNATTIQMQVNGITYERRLHASRAVYYKYRRLYDIYQGNEAAIATSFRRGTFRLPQMSQAQLHFIDTCLLLYYGTTRASKMRVYRLARDILEQRTGGYWVDPGRCGSAMAENLVTELLDLTLPLPAILDNPEKAALLTPIEMPRAGWFYGYAKYVEAQPDQGAQLMTERLGKDLWEHFYLVFDTFVHRAQFPLQYVFADHWLLDAWIVDEETRATPSRLWLTLLIDAYSRSILGMALLYEDPWYSRPSNRRCAMPSGKKRLTGSLASRKSGTAPAFHYNCCWTMPGRITPTAWKISHASSHAMESTTPSTWCFARPTRGATVRSLSGSSKTFRARSKSWPLGPLFLTIRKISAPPRTMPACSTQI